MPLRILRALLFVIASSGVAAADDKSACVASYSSAQDLRIAGKLIEAQRELRACAGMACTAFIAHDCAQWLEEVESSMPTVVVSAKDGAGHDVTDVAVSVDGDALLTRLDGRAVPMNPGPHTLAYHYADAVVTEQVLVRMGDKNRPLEVTFTAPKAPQVAAERREHVAVAPVVTAPPRSHLLQTLGFVGLGVGGALVIAGGVFGVAAIATKGARCTNGACDPGTVSTLETETTLSTVGVIVGAMLVATAVTLVVIGMPKHRSPMSLGPAGCFFRW